MHLYAQKCHVHKNMPSNFAYLLSRLQESNLYHIPIV